MKIVKKLYEYLVALRIELFYMLSIYVCIVFLWLMNLLVN